MKEVQKHFNKASVVALSLIEKRARNELKRNKNLNEFIMGMGTYFFTRKDGSIAHDYKCRGVNNIIEKWDQALRLTGEPMRFTAKGKKVTDW